MPASNHLLISLLTTSFMAGFSLHCGSTKFLLHSSSTILCIQKLGLIPQTFKIAHPMALWCYLRTFSSLCFLSLDREVVMIIGRISKLPKYAYCKCYNSVLSSSFGSYSVDALVVCGLCPPSPRTPMLFSVSVPYRSHCQDMYSLYMPC